MNVRLDRVGHLEVDDEGNVGYIDTTSSEIGRDEDIALARADRVERRFSLLLVLAGMEGSGVPLREREVLAVNLERKRGNVDVRERVEGPSSRRRLPSSG